MDSDTKTRLDAISQDVDKVVKRQKLFHQRTHAAVDQSLQALQELQKQLQALNEPANGGASTDSGATAVNPGVQDRSAKAAAASKAAHRQVERFSDDALSALKELNNLYTKLGKSIDKNIEVDRNLPVPVDLTRAVKPDPFEHRIVDQVIAQHLYRQGRFQLGETFCNEIDLSLSETMRQPFVEMHEILQTLKKHDLEPALAWAKKRCQELRSRNSPLEFQLHRLRFLQLLQQGDRAAALAYARGNFPPHAATHLTSIQRLMGSLVYIDRLETSPYADLLLSCHWTDISFSFARECCSLLGLSYASPLFASINAGATALPTLLKMAQVMAGRAKPDVASDELPVEIDLGRGAAYHSIFTCPVLREQTTEDNPPVMLPCGHVISKQAMNKVARGMSSRFKCPYCPSEQTPTAVQQISF